MSERFRFTAYSERGRRTRGRVQAYTLEDALYQLQNQGVYVVSLLRDSLKKRRGLFTRDSFSYQEQFVLLGGLTSFLEAGFSIESALVHLRSSTRAPKVQQALDQVLNTLDGGAPFTEALQSSRLFPDFWIRVLAIGERTGDFPPLIRLFSRHLHEVHRLKAELLSSFLMPAVLLMLLAFWFWLFFTKTVPSLTLFFIQAGVPMFTSLPLYARGGLEGSLVAFRILGSGILSFLWVRQSYRMRGKVSGILDPAFLPVIGPLILQKRFLVCAMRLKLQIEAGIPFDETFETQQAISPMAKALIETGESTGRLPEMLDFLIRDTESALLEQCKRLAVLVRNFSILSVGILMGLLLLGFYGMLYSCYGSLASPR